MTAGGHGQPGATAVNAARRWVDLDGAADVTIVAGGRRTPRSSTKVWTTECSGEQTIEIRFHRPTPVRRVRLVSTEYRQSRTQETTVWASLQRGERHREIVRRQFRFSPSGATEDIEEYVVELEQVSAIHVRLVPSVDGQSAVARVSELHVATS
jgi:hypothetical protein